MGLGRLLPARLQILRRANWGLWLSASHDNLPIWAHGIPTMAGFIDVPQSSVAGCPSRAAERL